MPKRTRKYVAALEAAAELKITNLEDAEQLYQELNERNYFWEPEEGWLPGAPPNAPTPLLRIRVWAETSKVEAAAQVVVAILDGSDYRLLEQSKPYQCRPPQQLESRIYLTFQEE